MQRPPARSPALRDEGGHFGIQAQPSDFSPGYERSESLKQRLVHGPNPRLLNSVF
jgi:hypothetical protein